MKFVLIYSVSNGSTCTYEITRPIIAASKEDAILKFQYVIEQNDLNHIDLNNIKILTINEWFIQYSNLDLIPID